MRWPHDSAVPCWWGLTRPKQLSIATKSEHISFSSFFGSIGSIPSNVVAVRCPLWLFVTVLLICTSKATSHNYTHFLSFIFILWEPWAHDFAVPCRWGRKSHIPQLFAFLFIYRFSCLFSAIPNRTELSPIKLFIDFQVKPIPPDDLSKVLETSASGGDSHLKGLLDGGNVDEAAQMAYSILTAVDDANVGNDRKQAVSGFSFKLSGPGFNV